MANLKYPLNSLGGYDYQGKITFGVATVRDNVEELTKYYETSAKIKEFNEAGIPGGKSAQSALSPGEREAYNGFLNTTHERFGETPDTSKGSCSLYLPQGIQFTDGAEYQNIDLGAVGAVAERAVNTGQGITSAIANVAANEVGSLISSIASGNTDAAKQAGARLAARYGGEKIGGGVQSALQITANPNSRSLFRAVAIRKFTFAFKLIPNSQPEAEEIKKIVKFFRSNMYPEETSFAEISYAYRYPAPFLIRMSYKNKDVATKILPAYLENVAVGYNSTTMGMHQDGNFIETDLQLSFVETRALKKSEVEGDY
jgi:hypothetical protein